jgi:hypothetical protein
MWPSSPSNAPLINCTPPRRTLHPDLVTFTHESGHVLWNWCLCVAAMSCASPVAMHSHLGRRSNDMSSCFYVPCRQFDPSKLFHCFVIVCDVSIQTARIAYSVFDNLDTTTWSLTPYSTTIHGQSILPAHITAHITHGRIHACRIGVNVVGIVL